MDTELDTLLNSHFPGKVVRKDLTKQIKEGANVPVYVLEYLLGQYCASDDDKIINDGLDLVKQILTENYVRPDEAEITKSIIREKGSHKIIDKVTVTLNEKKDVYEAVFSNLGIKRVIVPGETVKRFQKLLAGGIWCIVTLLYRYEEGQNVSPFILQELKPIQMPNMDMETLFEGRKGFTEGQWIDVLLRSTGLEPSLFKEREKWHFIARMIPFVESNYNMCELGPRGTGKSHLYKEISPNSILVSGGQTTVPNLFYNLGRRAVGLVGLWDIVAFDEVAGISFKEKDGIQIMKDYMASGSFSRGRDYINAYASMVFIGNTNQSVSTMVKTSHLLAPFPGQMIDSAFFDRFHYYIPGWEVPKMRPEYLTNNYGFIVDYLAEYFAEMRKYNFYDAIDKYFKLGRDLNQRDTIAVRKTVSGLLKLLYPHGEFDKEAVEKCLRYALEGRRRVKEQLKKIGGMEFYDVHFSYLDNELEGEKYISVPEQGGTKLIPEGPLDAGVVHTVSRGTVGHLGLFRIEVQMTGGNGTVRFSGLGSNAIARECLRIAYDFFRANASRISITPKAGDFNYHIHVVELHNSGPSNTLTLATLLALASSLMKKHVLPQLVVLGSMSLGGNIVPAEGLAESMRVALDSGAKRILLPSSSVTDIQTVPGELLSKFQTNFYADPIDAVFKAMGVE